mmetsp:Transcript_29445/g.57652  ORF Transcript_29445/g.57652 Transcript_29445/m.57652 type:complete len:200 (-) Transcript_29445:58-657(-)
MEARFCKDAWWKWIKTHHAVVGIYHFENCEHGKDFTFRERCLFLGMAIATAWYGIYLKKFYLRTWIPLLFDEVYDELDIFPASWVEDYIDSAACSILGGMVDLLLGKELIRGIMKKDWESRGGVRGLVSFVACAYAFALSAGAGFHMAFVYTMKPNIKVKLLFKWFGTVMMKLAFVETGILTMKHLIAERSEAAKAKAN